METKTFRSHGKRWTLPKVLRFGVRYSDHGFGGYAGEYDVEWRRPKAGEWFISGAIPTAYKAFSDMIERQLVVTATHEVRKVERWERV